MCIRLDDKLYPSHKDSKAGISETNYISAGPLGCDKERWDLRGILQGTWHKDANEYIPEYAF